MVGACEKEEARVRKGKTQKLAADERQVHIALHKLMCDILKRAAFVEYEFIGSVFVDVFAELNIDLHKSIKTSFRVNTGINSKNELPVEGINTSVYMELHYSCMT